jgi:hypothetical protein
MKETHNDGGVLSKGALGSSGLWVGFAALYDMSSWKLA